VQSIFYGLPSAALLAIELLRQQQQNLLASPEIPRPETIKNICVFISSLEWVVSLRRRTLPNQELTIKQVKPDDGNSDLCHRAKVMLEKILDSILDSHPKTSIPVDQQAPPDPVSWIDDIFSGGWMASGPFVDGTSFDDMAMYGSGLDWSFQL
jgi:hypothetical protein